MGNRKFAIKVLEDKGSVIIQCNGHSMEPLIFPKESIHLRKVDRKLLRIGDAVFCRLSGGLQVHMVSAIDEPNNRWQISNRKGWINGWIGPQAIFGLAVQVEDRVLVSEKELQKRAEEENNKVKK
jgi:hypothetical protein